MSMNIFRARVFEILNIQFCATERDQDRSYEVIARLDAQIVELVAGLPWYFQLDENNTPVRLPEPLGERLTWQHHILRTCISTQRIRMYRQYLHPRTGDAWQNCVSAARDSLLVYSVLRRNDARTSRQKFLPQAYQVFSVAVTVIALLLVEGSLPIRNVRGLIRDMTDDLGMVEKQGCQVPVATHGRRVLMRMLALLESRDTGSASPEEVRDLVPDIAIILGGEQKWRAYMNELRSHNARGPADDSVPGEVWNQDGDTGIPGNDAGEGTVERDETGGAEFSQSSALDLADASMSGEMDSDLFLEDTRQLGLLNWDMTGLLLLDPPAAGAGMI